VVLPIEFLTVYINNGKPLFNEETFKVMTSDNIPLISPDIPANFAGIKVESAIAQATGDVEAWFDPAPGKQGQGLSFLIQKEDVEGMRRKGSLSWAGLTNLYW
jgi:hypothetical protein